MYPNHPAIFGLYSNRDSVPWRSSKPNTEVPTSEYPYVQVTPSVSLSVSCDCCVVKVKYVNVSYLVMPYTVLGN